LDEILTGFYRTGSVFAFTRLGIVPDVVLIGKALGNGFPVSGVVVDGRYPIVKSMLPGSTFAGNPLAAAVVVATLSLMRDLELPGRVAAIHRTVRGALGGLGALGAPLRGEGALWILELPAEVDAEALVVEICRAGVAVGYTGRQLRLPPAATIEADSLARACRVVRGCVRRAIHADP
jgi:acetylornithine/succinyldiaminopimelate/putrescine aminotransferase